ncbi:MAG: hypothetical protein IKM53_04420 [Clostridia bacterium]|nr:hypothetical protein [Clostridia bacterium]
MNYCDFARDLLRNKRQLEASYENISFQLETLEIEKFSASGNSACCAPKKGGGSTYEDKLVSLIMLTDRYREKLKNLSKSLAAIELGLSVMDDYEKDLLNAFYVYGLKDAADSLSAKYYKERAQVYRDRMEALKKFTRAVFGVVET